MLARVHGERLSIERTVLGHERGLWLRTGQVEPRTLTECVDHFSAQGLGHALPKSDPPAHQRPPPALMRRLPADQPDFRRIVMVQNQRVHGDDRQQCLDALPVRILEPGHQIEWVYQARTDIGSIRTGSEYSLDMVSGVRPMLRMPSVYFLR